MTEPNDRELERYLKGDSKLSRAYKDASREGAPPELDEKILALARVAARPKPGFSRVLAPVALAASLIFGVNLAWNLHDVQPLPAAVIPAQAGIQKEKALDVLARADDKKAADAASARQEPAPRSLEQDRMTVASESARGNLEAGAAAPMLKREAKAFSAPQGAAPQPAAAMADAPASPPAPLTEPQKIDRLIAYVGGLQGAVFIRNGDEHTLAEAVEHLKMKREKAGDRVKTADDFIRLCASRSYLSGKAYQIRFPDGRTRTSEDVLREELARLSARE